MQSMATPAADLPIDAALVRALLQAQHPDLAQLPISELEPGWDNALFTLGDSLLVRLPRREAAAELLRNEQRWLPVLPQLPLPISAPLRIGVAAHDYPWNWSVLPWLPGTAADQAPPNAGQAVGLAECLRALHVAAPNDAPRNQYRGVPLQTRAAAVAERLAFVRGKTDCITPQIEHAWRQSLLAPIDVPDTWLHGDLHARNVLVADGRISAIIDWGDIAQGDCATDLAAIWTLLPTAESRGQAMDCYGGSVATWQRALGWAVFFGVTLLATGLVDNPRHAAMGMLTLQRISEGANQPWGWRRSNPKSISVR
jgi:aminoglycoside phosphotransferase (APT) family kinase protein